MDMKWYLVYTKPGFEIKVSDKLTQKKVESYCPVHNKQTKWTAAKKEIKVPLFKGYVFVKFAERQLSELKKLNGIVNLVYWMGKPVTVKMNEIRAIRHFLNEYTDITVEKTVIKHDASHVALTPELEHATMITIKNKKAYINIPSIGYVISAEVETANVRIISANDILNEDVKPNNLFSKVSEFNNSLKNYWAKAFIIAVSFFILLS